jgi:hypothetical protein
MNCIILAVLEAKKYSGKNNNFLYSAQKLSRFLSNCINCAENTMYVFPEMKLRGLVPNSYIHVSVSDLYIPRIGVPIWLQQYRQTDLGNI